MSRSHLETYLRSFQADQRLHDFQRPIHEDLVLMQSVLRDFFLSRVGLVHEVGDHLLGMAGKRFRPALTLLIARLGAPPAGDPVFAAAVIELIHTATLVHDDTIDKSAMRRGLPTINALYNDLVATILGDYIYTKVLVDLLDRGEDRIVRVVARTTYEMSIGEMLQIQQKRNLGLTEGEYLELVDAKTASLMAASCEVGAIVGGFEQERIEQFRHFGLDLGRAYQITDDIFDYAGDAAQLGKYGQSDLAEGKVTLPLIRALARSDGAERKRVGGILERSAQLTAEDWQFVRGLLDRTRALDECRDTAASLAGKALARLDGLPADPLMTGLRQAVDYAVTRSH
ncbi:MAG: polyprenyl synthetase family protein [Candidatus Eisenbacteria bacterium]